MATGDAANVAARLEQAAEPGEVLLGEPTIHLVRDAVEVEAVAPLELKGKAGAVPAHRLLRVLEAPERRHETRFVGREHELRSSIDDALEPGLGGAALRGSSRSWAMLPVQDTPGRLKRLRTRRQSRARAVSALRRGDHLLARRRGAEAARRAAAR